MDGRLLLLWGKTSESDENCFHPLLFHCLDTASVLFALWESAFHGALKGALSANLCLSQEQAWRWLAFLVALHDIGKATPAFQGLSKPLRTKLAEAGYEFPRLLIQKSHHSVLTALTLEPILTEGCGFPAVDNDMAICFAQAVGGHHGVFPRAETILGVSAKQLGDRTWSSARQQLVEAIADVLDMSQCSPVVMDPREKPALRVFLAGRARLAGHSSFDPDGSAGPSALVDGIDDPDAVDAVVIADRGRGVLLDRARERLDLGHVRVDPLVVERFLEGLGALLLGLVAAGGPQ